MPRPGNIAKTMTSNRKQFTFSREMLPVVARDESEQLKIAWCSRWNLGAFFLIYFCFVSLYINYLLALRSNELFSSGISKQNSLFPSGPVTERYCYLYNSPSYSPILITSVTHSATPRVPLFCSYHILTSSVIYYWTNARQHGIYLLNSWRFSRYSAPIHWLVYGHVISNNETVSHQMSRETLRFEENTIHCSPRDQSLTVQCWPKIKQLLIQFVN